MDYHPATDYPTPAPWEEVLAADAADTTDLPDDAFSPPWIEGAEEWAGAYYTRCGGYGI